ncbi:MAG: hypothetical protein ACKVHE_28310 [Planctomycetales bacterium]
MRILAYILFGGGIMAAISGAAKLPAAIPEGTTPTFLDHFPDTLPEFTIAFLATVVGLVIWWKDVFAQRKANQDNDSDKSNPLTLLAGLIPQLHELAGSIDELDGDTIIKRVEHILEHTVLPFAEARQKLFDRLGMRAGADLLVTAAYGERMLNRTWSAAADGHLPEARTSFREAAQAFDEAAAMLPSLESPLA